MERNASHSSAFAGSDAAVQLSAANEPPRSTAPGRGATRRNASAESGAASVNAQRIRASRRMGKRILARTVLTAHGTLAAAVEDDEQFAVALRVDLPVAADGQRR